MLASVFLVGCGSRQESVVTLSEYYARASFDEAFLFKSAHENCYGFAFGNVAERNGMRDELTARGILIHRKIGMVGFPDLQSEFYKEYEGLLHVVRAYDLSMYRDGRKAFYLESWLIKEEDDLLQWFLDRHPEYFIAE
jgi:hypothetical protein